jgi:hypothetical protein
MRSCAQSGSSRPASGSSARAKQSSAPPRRARTRLPLTLRRRRRSRRRRAGKLRPRRTPATAAPLFRRTTRRTPPLAGRTKLRRHAHDLLRQTSRLRRSLRRVRPKAAISRAGRAAISLLAPAYVRARRRSLDARDRRSRLQPQAKKARPTTTTPRRGIAKSLSCACSGGPSWPYPLSAATRAQSGL